MPQGDYVAARRHGSTVYSAGMTPRRAGVMQFTGPVRRDDIGAARAAARLACANALRAVEATLDGGEAIASILTMTVYVVAETGFTEHSKVADFASEFLREELEDRGLCSRCAIGVANLPGGAMVEIQIVASVA
ncbi:MAG: RidA family protein [Rhodobacterales bacterium]|nr:RidA family protein [Rhodobacterales bacterium]